MKVISPQRPNLNLKKVAQPIDSETGLWKVELIKEMFIPHEAKTILSIPIRPRIPDDSLVWAWSKNIFFTIRNAYGVSLKLLKKASMNREIGECSNKAKVWALPMEGM